MNNSFNDNKDLNSNEVSYTMIKVIILLVTLQISRIIIKQLVFLNLPYSKLNEMLVSMFIMSLFIFFIISKAKKENLKLDVKRR